MQRVLLLLLCLGWAMPAAAQDSYPTGVRQALDRHNKQCLDEGGGKGAKFGPKIVRKIDLNGDGRDDYILDLDDTTCDGFESLFCGTGGCVVEILIAQRDGSYTSIFSDTVHRYEIKPGRGVRTIRFSLHGGFCGKHGPEPCAKTRRITGKPFKLRDY